MPKNTIFTRRLVNVMNLRGVRQIELSKNCDISKQKVSQYCSGRCIPNAMTLDKIANYLNVTKDYLLGNDNPVMIEATIDQMKNQILGVGLMRMLFEKLEDKEDEFIEKIIKIIDIIDS